MAQIYPYRSSIPAGGTLTLHSSSPRRFRIDFYRVGANLQLMQNGGWLPAAAFPAGSYDSDWGWQGYDFPIPNTWPSGVYLALAIEEGSPPGADDPSDRANDPAMALFVVTSASPGQNCCILYKVPLFTYHAYNQLGNPAGSLYTGAGYKVTMRRPGGGVGGDAWDQVYPDVYQPGSVRQTFPHWDLPFIQWLETQGYGVEYCTDLDLHEDGTLLSAYRLLLSVGHDEYWSTELRSHIESFIGNGGNVAFFSGNVCWWRVHLTDSNTAFTCDKSEHTGVPGPFDQWWTGQNLRPENEVTGVSYRNAGGSWSGPRPEVGYTVQYAGHWVYDGVPSPNGGPIKDGEVFGDQPNEALVGYECDGSAIADIPDVQGHLVPALTDATPASFLILGVGRLPWGWNDREAGDASTATMGIYQRGGIVFTGATTDWSRLLAHPAVDQITRNVLDRLRSRAVRILGLTYACGKHLPVEGATLKFHADTSKLPQQVNLTYSWSATGGTPASGNQPQFQVTLPSPPVAVTISVTIDDGTDCPGFGTLTFTPLTVEQMGWLELVCRIRELAYLALRWRAPLEGVREGNRFFVDPLWDPIRGLLWVPPSRQEARQVMVEARTILALAEGVLGHEGLGATGR